MWSIKAMTRFIHKPQSAEEEKCRIVKSSGSLEFETGSSETGEGASAEGVVEGWKDGGEGGKGKGE